VQSDIATKVAGALGLALAQGQKDQLSEKPRRISAAYDAYLKGEEASAGLSRRRPPSLRKALSFYEQAVSLDPGFALAWSKLSTAAATLYSNAVPTPAVPHRAREAAEKSIALAPGQADGYRALGLYYRIVVGDMERARQELEKALAIAPGRPDISRTLSFVEVALGRWNEGIERARQGVRLDPQSPSMALGDSLLRMRRIAEARPEAERILALVPDNPNYWELVAMTYLSEGDLGGARAILKRAAQKIGAATAVGYFAAYNDLVWLLDAEQTEMLRAMKPEDFDDAATWALCQTQAAYFAGDLPGAREYAQKARAVFEQQLGDAPNDPQLHSLLGLSLAYLGKKDEAIREGERAVALRGIARDGIQGPGDVWQLSRILTIVGEQEKAIDRLEQVLKVPAYLSPGWLKIDPNFDPLRKNPRFQKLVAGAK
jgi:tetratricopeptide (TPR) repeat protein